MYTELKKQISTGPNSIKLVTNCSWVKGIQVDTNKGPGALQRRDFSFYMS
jgi:hypothetical protein